MSIKIIHLSLIAVFFFGARGILLAENHVARSNGNWNADIWTTIPGGSPVSGVRPSQSDPAYLGVTNGRVSISSPVAAYEYSQRADGAVTRIEDGADICWFRFFGQRGRDAKKGHSGTFEMRGGTLTIRERFILAGFVADDIGVGTFRQSGGIVRLGGALQLTQTAKTAATIATGIYVLEGGILNIPACASEASGILVGRGKGKFEWSGGTLNCRNFFENLHNAGRGNLSPGGDGDADVSILQTQIPKVYRQGSNATFTTDIVSARRYDRLFWQGGYASEVTLRQGTTIAVYLRGGYVPAIGETFDIIVADRLIVEGAPRLAGADGAAFRAEKIVKGNEQIFRLVYAGTSPKKIVRSSGAALK